MAAKLPDYVASAEPVPQSARAAWFKNTAQTYAGIMLWFVFWNQVPVGAGLKGAAGWSNFAGGTLAQGLGVAFLGLIAAALICHFLFYLVPGLLGMKTGLPLYIVGTSTYGVQGGFLMPGFLMGLLQFGWLAVNAFFAGILLCAPFGYGFPSVPHAIVAAAWAALGAFMGLKGIQYVARVATFLPLIPLAILVILLVSTIGGVGDFDQQKLIDSGKAYVPVAETAKAAEQAAGKTEGGAGAVIDAVKAGDANAAVDAGKTLLAGAADEAKKVAEAAKPIEAQPALTTFGVIALITTYVVGFFATAGAAGADFGMNNRHAKDVQLGGLVGVALSTVFAGGVALLIVAGAHGSGKAGAGAIMEPTALMGGILGSKMGAVCMYLLAIAAFPPACFSSFIAANSFKTTLPKVNPFISCGIGTAVAIVLAITGLAGDAIAVFGIIGASFGPVCGAMMADYLLAGRKWAGPRAGWNCAGWVSWVVGFVVGAIGMVVPAMAGKIPCPPVAAFVVGFVLYIVLAKVGLETKVIPMGGGTPADEAE